MFLPHRCSSFLTSFQFDLPTETPLHNAIIPHFQDPVYVVGRIISLPTDTNKPTETSLLLESSRALGDGKRIPLRFSRDVKVRGNAPGAKGFGVWPGCLVGLKGRNGGGGAFVVEEVMLVSWRRFLVELFTFFFAKTFIVHMTSARILQPPPSEMPMSPPSDLITFQHDKMNGEPVSMTIAAGPYTLDSNLLYEPFEALMEVVRVDRPDVMVLVCVDASFFSIGGRLELHTADQEKGHQRQCYTSSVHL